MSDTKKYYYIKLKDNFFDSDQIVIMESMQDGVLYSNILLKLYLKSLKNNGLLMMNEFIPYSVEMIATLTRHPVGVVKQALSIFRQLGLIEILDNGAIFLNDIQLFIGQSSTEGERKKIARMNADNKIKAIGQVSDICPPEIELEIEKELEIDIEKDKKITQKSKRFVAPTLTQVTEYCNERKNNVDPQRFIDYYESNGWKVGKNKMKDWQASVRTWERRESKDGKDSSNEDIYQQWNVKRI